MSIKLMVAVPTYDYMHADFVRSLVGLTAELQRQRIAYSVEMIAGTLVYIARNRLARKAVNEHYTHVLWIDSDMVFNEKTAEDLMECGKEFVCGAFVSRRPTYGACVYSRISPVNEIEKVERFGLQPFRVDGCGFACVLTTTELLLAVMQKYGNCFDPMEHYGEDLAFCMRAKGIGREIWCDPTVRPGHIAHRAVYAGEKPFGEDDE